jgi:ABC-type sulfate/molybdate transport systems ATPase subunit
VDAAYSLKHVVFSYNREPALRVESLVIGAGELVALHGPNGSGKTTLLHLLAFVQTPQAGEIRFFQDKAEKSNLLAMRRRIGLLAQNPYLFRSSVIANVTWALRIRGVDRPTRRKRALQALEWVGLAGFEHRHARDLSGGEAQRVALARALVLEPDVLLLDEPASHMDRSSIRVVEEIVMQWNRSLGKTVIFSSHARVQDHALTPHRTLYLLYGRIAGHGSENIFPGRISDGGTSFETDHITFKLHHPVTSGDYLTVDPSRIIVSTYMPMPREAANAWRARIVAMSEVEDGVRLEVDSGERFNVLLTREAYDRVRAVLGQTVWLRVPDDAMKVLS